jgi:hypothetical protein
VTQCQHDSLTGRTMMLIAARLLHMTSRRYRSDCAWHSHMNTQLKAHSTAAPAANARQQQCLAWAKARCRCHVKGMRQMGPSACCNTALQTPRSARLT